MSIGNEIGTLMEKFQLKTQSLDAIQQAFFHSSYVNELKKTQMSNERLEFLGDGVLNLIIAQYLYEQFPDFPEGELTKKRAQYVREEALVVYGQEINISEYIFLGKGEEKTGGRLRAAILADAFEAFIGSIFISHGFNKAREVLLKIIEPVFKEQKLKLQEVTDYKSMFQELIQVDPHKRIVYQIVSEEGPAHSKTYQMSVLVDDIVYGSGIGKTKKDAEQKAALEALNKMVSISTEADDSVRAEWGEK